MAVSVGVDVGGTKILAIAVETSGRRVGREVRRPTPHGTDALLDGIVGVVTEARASAGDVDAVGLGVPGLVDRSGKLVVGPNLPGIVGVAFRDELQARLDLPVAVDNDATCATWAEVRLGAAKGSSEAFLVTLGTGIGGGLVTGGALQRGANGFAGEAGHMVVDPKGPPCPCGRRGCWERFASGSGLGRLAREAAESGRGRRLIELAGGDPDDVRGEHVTRAAKEGNAEAIDVFREFGWWAALGIANLVNVLDPEIVVVGGGLVEAGAVVMDPIRAAYSDLVLAGDLRPEVRIVPAELGGDAGAIGAALIGFDRRDN
ncbi:MAG TPA: ROK family protein [Acidimicrobiales bacterium]|jgi:glucokinase|nr:ROK family protein [Acidimicrobiales bacterium]